MFQYNWSLLLGNFVEVVCCNVFYVHFTLLMESCFFVGLLFFDVYRVLFKVLSRSLFSFFLKIKNLKLHCTFTTWEDNIKTGLKRRLKGSKLVSLRILAGGGLLWIHQWTIMFQKVPGISCLPEKLQVSQEEHYPVKLRWHFHMYTAILKHSVPQHFTYESSKQNIP